MKDVESLRKQLLEVAGAARTFHIRKQMEDYENARVKAEQLLGELRDICRLDQSLFTQDLLDDIRVAKISARLLTIPEIKHREFLEKRGIKYRGTRLSTKTPRIAHCYICRTTLDSSVDIECVSCGWILCVCGACGCGYSHDYGGD